MQKSKRDLKLKEKEKDKDKKLSKTKSKKAASEDVVSASVASKTVKSLSAEKHASVQSTVMTTLPYR